MAEQQQYVLVTGATGFIGAHVVDQLLARGIRVRGATRSLAKGEAMMKARPQYAGKLDFVLIADFEQENVFDEAVKGVDGVIHTASPLTYTTTNNERELLLPAINGVLSLLRAAALVPTIRRIVLTSSFASVMDASRTASPSPFPYFTYTASDWNPLTYAESIAPTTSAVIAYRGSKKFAELAAWEFVREHKPQFDIATLCPPMTFGPVVHPVQGVEGLNESNAMLWKVASGERPLPVARVPFWVDVRDVAKAHVEALVRPEAGGKRFLVASPERFSYGLAAEVVVGEFKWARERVVVEEQRIDESHGVDGQTAAADLGLEYRSFRDTVTQLVRQAKEMENA
ncbi:hypothetical protein N0V88_005502 [Collariella sp. IMI 366227]|nr:hypothetical protein N0V88_005502 [Collariella sp. IMI 366227]